MAKKQVIEWHKKGQACFSKGSYSESIEAYKKALEIDPYNLEIWYDLGAAYKYSGKESLFIAAYKYALSIELARGPEEDLLLLERSIVSLGDLKMVIISVFIMLIVFFIPAVFIAGAYSFLALTLFLIVLCLCATLVYGFGKRRSIEPKRIYESTRTDITEFRRLLESDPTDIFHWVQLISTFFDLNLFQNVVDLSKIALVVDPENAQIMNLLGQSFYGQGKYEEAIDAHINVLKSHSKEIDVQNISNCIIKYCVKNGFEKGIGYCQKILKMDSSLDKIWATLGSIHNKLNQYDDSIQACTHALGIDQDNIMALNNIGFAYISLKEYENALNPLNRASILEPKSYRTLYNISHVNIELKNFDRAIATLKRVLDINPQFDFGYNDLGFVYIKKDDYENAIKFLKKAIELNSQFASPYKHIGYIYYKEGNYQKAIKYVKKSLELDPNYLLAYYLLAKIYIKIGQYKHALNSCKKCLEINPTSEYSKKLKVKLSQIKTESNLLQ